MVCYIHTHTWACFLSACYCKFELCIWTSHKIYLFHPAWCLIKTSVLALRVPISCKEDEKRKLRTSLKDSSNKILLFIWRATLTFKAPKDTLIKIFQIRNDILSLNLKSYFLPLQFIFYYFLLKKKRNVL